MRAAVAREWQHEREKEIKSAYLGKLREKYGLVVETNIQSLLPSAADGSAIQ